MPDMSRWDKRVVPMTPAEKRRIDKDLIPAKKKLHVMLKQYHKRREQKFIKIAASITKIMGEMAAVIPIDRIPHVLTMAGKVYVKHHTEKRCRARRK